jgi:hypothetical protein
MLHILGSPRPAARRLRHVWPPLRRPIPGAVLDKEDSNHGATYTRHPTSAYRIRLLSAVRPFVRDLAKEFGSKGIAAVVERFIEAEQADFCWEGRISERSLGVYEDGFDEGKDPRAEAGSARKEPRTREKNRASR